MGRGAWTLRYRSIVVVAMLGGVPAVVLGCLIFYIATQEGDSMASPLIFVAVTAGLNVVILADAYRRWLRVELA